MRKVIVTGFIKTSSPLHIAAPSSARFNPETGDKSFDKKGGIPVTSIQTMGIPGTSEKTDDKGNVTVRPSVIPVAVFPGNNASGRTRRTTADVFLEALQALGQKVDINTYSAIKTGAATGSPSGTPIDYAEYERATNHPFLGLLGGGPRLIKRKARVFNAFALCDATKDLLARNRVPYNLIYSGWEQVLALHVAHVHPRKLQAIWSFRRTDDLRDLSSPEMAKNSIEDFLNAYNKRQAAIIAEQMAGKDAAKSKTSIFTFQSLEFVVPGVSFPYVCIMDAPTDAQAGLWFLGFERFVQNESIGGWSRNGFGNFTFEDGRIAVVDDGELTSEQYAPGSPDQDGDSYRMKAVTAWMDAAEHITADEINWLMRLPVEKTDKKKVKVEAEADDE